ncbi:MAG: glycoside hydrolase family protein [Enterobacter sp.]|uniref:Lysozyme n=1 Tax=Enterobacter ludwigii TaxID=299767 RepID=A0AAX3LEN7_9ENTR|nr:MULTISPECIES: glycoside hydrolase family protein [Enterobacter]MCU4029162.1 glycoside hydrolase family protein [Enterobacter roggenkampii]MDU6061017.1 glycoside hydrolase family protein [Enterobacter sp.]URE96823.1 glycoside hydrolase family protein [Enterobacter kobei]WCE14742.1 glycoside hydrolase family protein [Enterobacter ludwigii]SAE51344.1 muraminidase [Enterobacter roggenkampii]
MSDLKTRLKEYEGTKAYQAKLKYYRNEKFYPYADSLGFQTIGYGHLITRGESYPDGITEVQAEELLDHDIMIAQHNLDTLDIWLPNDWRDFMVIMIFQLGLAGVCKFKLMLKALKEKNYPEAIKQAKNSRWYQQTPNRVDQMIAALTNK